MTAEIETTPEFKRNVSDPVDKAIEGLNDMLLKINCAFDDTEQVSFATACRAAFVHIAGMSERRSKIYVDRDKVKSDLDTFLLALRENLEVDLYLV